MKCLVVVAHPLEDSLCQYLAKKTVEHLRAKGYQVTVKDLYQQQFDPVLTVKERDSYYKETFSSQLLHQDIEELKQSQSLVLVFPTWWFNFPAILKGWFDRVWVPGHAYNHASDFGPLTPLLTNLKEIKVVTTLGSPWWVDNFVLFKPVRRIIKVALMGACTTRCKFDMLSLYNSEKVTAKGIDNFVKKIRRRF